LPELLFDELLFELLLELDDPEELDFDRELEFELLTRRLEFEELELRCELGRLSITAPRSVSIFKFSKL
jgi:hypothetical protein